MYGSCLMLGAPGPHPFVVPPLIAAADTRHKPFVATGHLYFESKTEFQTAFGPHAEAIMANIPNYTDIAPTIQISEVMVYLRGYGVRPAPGDLVSLR
jgi:uncharacterized protein (TIGR02118 family)